MRSRRQRTCTGASRFDDQNRRGTVTGSNLFDSINKLRTPAQFFKINQDYLGIGILVQITQQIKLINIGLVTDRNKF